MRHRKGMDPDGRGKGEEGRRNWVSPRCALQITASLLHNHCGHAACPWKPIDYSLLSSIRFDGRITTFSKALVTFALTKTLVDQCIEFVKTV